MKQVNKLKQLSELPYFDTQSIGQITGLTEQGLNNTVSRWLRNGLLIQLKRGRYVTKDYFRSNRSKREYIEFVSNKIRFPSYLSLEYILASYQILSESVFSITAITTKSTRDYTNKLGRFTYRSIQEDLFTGFEIVKKGKFDVAIASKAKALFDYLYLKFYRSVRISKKDIEELRLNLDSFDTKEVEEFGQYCEISNIQKYKKLPQLLFA
ncbi:MAG: hypothetical protein ACE5DX_04785 [Candidatus Dojkabacteria bacterium]